MTDSISDDTEAARWAIRLDGAPLGDVEQDALDSWIAQDERRAGALLRAEATLAYLDRGRALAAVPDMPRKARDWRWPAAALAGAAAIAAALVAVIGPLSEDVAPVEIRTAIGEVRRVPLSDGSVASVNTGSRIAVAMRNTRRDVRLDTGEAWFQVSHDTLRPFVVAAGAVRVRAVGTAFSVRRHDGGADVLVTEGVVETWVEGQPGPHVRITAGSRGFVAPTLPAAKVVEASDAIDRTLAWRMGEMALNGESLSYAVAELNRYNRHKLVVKNAALGREPLVGYFRTDQPDDFARAVGGMLGARVRVDGDVIELSR